MSPSKHPSIDVLTVAGARPQFIKSVAVTRALAARGRTEWFGHSGQYPDDGMGLDFLRELGGKLPDAQLHPNQDGRTLRMADMMAGIAREIEEVRPKTVLVYGDTDSTLAGALAAHHAGVPLLHVEAGLRSGDRGMPEEHNRILTDQLSDLLFTTGPIPTGQLLGEGAVAGRIVEVGDVMLDVALAFQNTLRERNPPDWEPKNGPALVVTLHRPATVDSPEVLSGALTALGQWCKASGGWVYFPVHPRTAASMQAHGLSLPSGVVNPGPIGYLDMQAALFHAQGVLTDSGGLQKEAWFQGTSAVVLRDTTEWSELLEIGASSLFDPHMLVGPEAQLDLVDRLLSPSEVPSIAETGLFGGGHAAEKIVTALESVL